jgi:glycosyltransferase involved in cell wall biosynthesis
MLKVGIVSLKFNPGHLSLMRGYYFLIRAIGADPELVLTKKYSVFSESMMGLNVVYLEDKLKENINKLFYDVFLIYNPSIYNIKYISYLKKLNSKLIYLYHEPLDSFNNYLKEGIRQMIKGVVANIVSKLTLSKVDLVIVPSKYAYELYKKQDIKINKNVIIIPLIFDDEKIGLLDINKKIYFSFIGNAVKAHGFDIFLELIKYIYKIGYDIKFQISTRNDLTKIIKKEKIIDEMVKSGYLKIMHGRPLSNEEINNAYDESFCVWNVYRRSTQSAVLPKAFMFGAPVISSYIGSFSEFVTNGYNGYFLHKYNESEVLFLISKILSNLNELSENARKSFFKYFYWENYINEVKRSFDILTGK